MSLIGQSHQDIVIVGFNNGILLVFEQNHIGIFTHPLAHGGCAMSVGELNEIVVILVEIG